jgi:hypothetical protein
MICKREPMKKISTLFFVVKKFCNKAIVCRASGELSGLEDSTEEESLACCPSDQSVRRILDYALACDVMKTKTAGYIEMNLN